MDLTKNELHQQREDDETNWRADSRAIMQAWKFLAYLSIFFKGRLDKQLKL